MFLSPIYHLVQSNKYKLDAKMQESIKLIICWAKCLLYNESVNMMSQPAPCYYSILIKNPLPVT